MAKSRVKSSKGEEQRAHIAEIEDALQHTHDVIDLTKLEVARSNRLLDTSTQQEAFSDKSTPEE